MNNTEFVVWTECSDEEEFSKAGVSYGNAWAPLPEEVVEMYQRLSKSKFIQLNWKCPGRKNPYEEEKLVAEPEQQDAPPESATGSTDFEFEEDSTPFMRRVPGKALPKGSAKKKTTSLAGILSNMERHRIMDKMANPNDNTSETPK